MQLECILTNEEKLKYSKARAEDNLKSYQPQTKAQIASFEATINLLADKLNSGTEYRDVVCDIIVDYKAKTKSFIRKDTGQTARLDELSEKDLQQELKI